MIYSTEIIRFDLAGIVSNVSNGPELDGDAVAKSNRIAVNFHRMSLKPVQAPGII